MPLTFSTFSIDERLIKVNIIIRPTFGAPASVFFMKICYDKQMSTITQKEFKHLVRRQGRVEQELEILKKIVRQEVDETQIRPLVLKRWERISRDLDLGKGRAFDSALAMRSWLKRL